MLRRALALALVTAAAVPAVAAARVPPPLRLADGRVPSARVESEGGGTITFTGRMVVNGSVGGGGTVTIQDWAGDAQAYLAGTALRFGRNHRVVVRRAAGILYVAGSNVRVRLVAPALAFAAAGNGRARFIGRGVYRLNGGDEHAWAGGWIRIAPPPDRHHRGDD